MRARLFLLLLMLAACRTPPPSFTPVPKPPEMPEAPLPEPVTQVVAPRPPTATAEDAPPKLDPLVVALAAHDTPTLVALLADDVTFTLANGDAVAGRSACEAALRAAIADVEVHVAQAIQANAHDVVLLGDARVAQRNVAFAVVLKWQSGHVVEARVYANTAPWRYTQVPPKPPVAPLAIAQTHYVTGEPAFASAPIVAAFEPTVLAKDATAAGLVALDLLYHETTTGADTDSALKNQAALRAFQAAFDVHEARLVGQFAAGEYLVIEREVTLSQRAPVVPVPPTEDVLRVRTLEVLLLRDGVVVEAWGYSDPVALLPAVEQPPIPAIH